MKLDFNLPKPAELGKSDFYAVNLRRSGSCLTPVGLPLTLLPKAGHRNFRLPSGKILSVGSDRLSLFIDGKPVGSLSSPFGSLLPDGPDDDCIILTADSAPEWLVDGQLRGKFTPLQSEINLSAVNETPLEQSVEPVKLSSSYPRSSGTLTAPDSRKAADVLQDALSSLEQRAAGAAMRVQPVWMAWQILDAAGKVISRSEPVLIHSSAGFQGSSGVEMTLTRKDNKFTDCSPGSLQVNSYAVRLKIERAADSWRRSRAASLEIIASRPLEFITGAVGAFNMVNSSTSTLYLSPLGSDPASIKALETRTRSEFPSSARVIARVSSPLEGVDMTIGVSPIDTDKRAWTETIAEPHAVCAFRVGSAVVYADASNPGMLLAARTSSPLAPVGYAKVATSRIHAFCSPVGSYGGWNYGRYHLLAFAADGVYAVAIDRSLTSISSSLIHSGGISSPSAVVSALDAIYFATADGSLLRLRGISLSSVSVPFPVASLAFVEATGELWMTAADSSVTATLHLATNRISVRTDIRVTRFDAESALAIDSDGALRDLCSETPEAVAVQWTRRIAVNFRSSMVEWRIDSPFLSRLELTLAVDGGGVPQRVNSLTVNGRLNAPLRLRVFSPARPYLSVIFNGIVDPSTRFSEVNFIDYPHKCPKI